MVLHCDLLTIRYRCLSVAASTLPKHSGVFLCSKHTLISAIHLRFFRYDVRSPRCQEGIFACDSFDARILLKEDLYCEIDRRVCFLAICCSIRVASATGPCAALSPEKTTITAAFSQAKGSLTAIPTACAPILNPILVTSADVCRVQSYVTTVPDSSVKFGAWLPDVWYDTYGEILM